MIWSCFCNALILYLAHAVYANDWTTRSRFEGFYFKLHINKHVNRLRLIENIVEKADSLFGFGWIQEDPSKNIIKGEFRGSKQLSPEFLSFLQSLSDSSDSNVQQAASSVDVHKYEDTRIHYHFTEFRRLSSDDQRFPIDDEEEEEKKLCST